MVPGPFAYPQIVYKERSESWNVEEDLSHRHDLRGPSNLPDRKLSAGAATSVLQHWDRSTAERGSIHVGRMDDG